MSDDFFVMFLKYLQLTNFRLHRNSLLHFSEGLNYIIGGNGQGKTTILEAIYYASTTKSFIGSDSEVVTFNENFFEIKANIQDMISDTVIIRYDKFQNRKFYSLNGKLISSPQEIVGKYPVVLLSPIDSKITEELPQERRKFVDSVISQISINYLKNLLEYKRILKQRASLLAEMKENKSNDFFEELEVWNEKLIEVGSKLILARKEFIEEFNEYVNNVYHQIMNGQEEPLIVYETIDFNSEAELVQKFRDELEKKREAELRRAMNLVGPHKDEFRFLINGIELRVYGSQGQHKTFQVALRFAEYFYLMNKVNKNPLFLLDDVFGELDQYRSRKISEHLSELGQAFITLTDFNNYQHLIKSSRDQVIRIENGESINA